MRPVPPGSLLCHSRPEAGSANKIESSVWAEPHIGGEHGFVEWARVVVDQQTLLATAAAPGSGMEAWRGLRERERSVPFAIRPLLLSQIPFLLPICLAFLICTRLVYYKV